jgi:hypothetical protein
VLKNIIYKNVSEELVEKDLLKSEWLSTGLIEFVIPVKLELKVFRWAPAIGTISNKFGKII